MGRKLKSILVLLLAAFTGMVFYTYNQASGLSEQTDLRHECYIWQRIWNSDLQKSIQQASEQVDALTVLAAEIDVRPGRQTRQIMPVKYDVLAALSKPTGLAIRVNPYAGPFETDSEATQYLVKTIQQVLTDAETGGVVPLEIQIDYDCAESKLDGYCQWIKHLKQIFPKHPITITALPSWMGNRKFKSLVRLCDGYVLQVHSLVRPESIDEEVVLCDSKQAIEWTKQAAFLNVPFRLAVPTYGYHLAYDQQGCFFSLSAEGPMRDWPAGTQIKTVLSDPKKIASMIQEIRAISPKQLKGVIWFRLPVPSDQLNWRWHTLQSIIRQQPLTENVEVVCRWPESNLLEVYLANSGDMDISAARIDISLMSDQGCLAADGLSGYAVLENKEGGLRICPTSEASGMYIHSQETIKIAWCRFNQKTEVNADVRLEQE